MSTNEQWAAIGDAIWEIIKWLVSLGGQIEVAKEYPLIALFGWAASIGAVLYGIKKAIDWLHP